MKKIYIFIAVVVVLLSLLFVSIQKMNHKENEFDEEVTQILEIIQSMDITVNYPCVNIAQEDEKKYLEGYLSILKNEIPVITSEGEKMYYEDLWKAGIEFDELLKEKGNRRYPYLYYYDDLDGDGKPELAVNQGCLYIFNYEPGEDEFTILYSAESCYVEKILGTGQIWYHDGLHAGSIRECYIVLDEKGEWKKVLQIEEGLNPDFPYYEVCIDNINWIDIGEKNWNEVIIPIKNHVKDYGIEQLTLEEIFGDLQHEE